MSTPNELLERVSNTLGAARNVEQLTRPLLELLEHVSGLESTYLTRIDTQAGVQTILFSRNTRTMQIPEGLSVPWNDTLCKRALDEGRAFTDDVAACWGDSEAARALGIKTYASMPVYLSDKSIYGTLCAASADRRPLAAEGRQTLALFSTLIAHQIEREELLQRLQKMNAALLVESSTDALTGLPNRRQTLADLHRMFALAERTGQHLLVAFIDLDGFKSINDCFGHDVGDVFLVEIAQRLGRGLRRGDVLGRLGGDEFLVVGLTSPADGSSGAIADAARRRLSPLVEGRFTIDGHGFDYPGASFGIVTVAPQTTTPAQALHDADMRMYADKKERAQKHNRAGSRSAQGLNHMGGHQQ